MQDHELMAWLGPAADDLTPEQIQRVADEARRIADRWPDPDHQPERDAALSAVVQHLLGETSAEEAARALVDARRRRREADARRREREADARRREREAYAAAETIAVALVHDGTPKATAARRAGIDRMSLLRALGER